MKTTVKNALIDTLISEGVAHNDAALCRLLKVQPALMSKVRTGRLLVTDAMRVAIMRKAKWSLKRIDELAPPEEA